MGGLGNVSWQSANGILNDWVSVDVDPSATDKDVAISTKEIDVENKFTLVSAPKLDHPKAMKSSGSQGVQHLSSVAHSDAVPGDMSSVRGARDTLMQYCSSFREKFLDQGGLAEAKKNFAERLAEMSRDLDTPQKRDAYAAATKHYEAFLVKCAEVRAARETLLAYFPQPRTGAERNLNPTDAYLDKQAMADLAEMKVAVRNFRYDYDKCNLPGKISNKRTLGQFFSTTRNKFFRAFTKMESMSLRGDADVRTVDEHKALNAKQQISKQAFAAEKALSRELYAMGAALAAETGTSTNTMPASGFEEARSKTCAMMSEGLLKLEEAVRTKNGDAPLSHAGREQLLQTLKEIGDPEKGGFKKLALIVTAGGVLPVPVAKLSLSAKYQYCLDISSTPGGGIRIERVHSGGVKFDASAGLGDAAKLHGSAEVQAGRATVLEFKNLEQAVKSLSSGKTKGVITGLWTGGVGASLATIPLKWLDRAFGQANYYNENSFLRYARKNGYLDKSDKTLAPGENMGVASKQKSVQIGGGGHVGVHALLAQMKGDLDVRGHRGLVSQKTEFRSFFVYLRSERKGEAANVYLKRAGTAVQAGEKVLEDEEAVKGILEREIDPENADKTELAQEREAVRAQLADLVKRVVDLSDEVNDELATGRKYSDDQMREIARMFPQATAAAQALMERLELLSADLPEAERKDDATLFGLVEQALSNPPIKFPQGVYDEVFNVTRAHLEGGGHFEFDARFSYDLSLGQDSVLLTETPLASSETYSSGTTAEKVGKGALRAVAAGTSSVATDLLARASTLQVHVTRDTPKTNDPRPWKKHNVTSLDIKLKDNLSTKAIVALVMQAVTKTLANEKSGCKEAGLSAGGVAIGELTKFVSGAFSRAASDFMNGSGADESIKKGLSPLTESMLDDYVWESMKNIRLTWEDGQIASISFGQADTMRVVVNAEAGHFKATAGFDYESLVNSRTVVTKPSFETMVGYCDAFLKNDNRAAWKKFSATNRKAFLKTFKALSGQDKSAKGMKSLDQVESLRMRMRDEIDAETDPALRRRLEKCFDEMNEALAKLREDSLRAMPTDETKKSAEQNARVEDVRAVLEAAARYFDVYEDRQAGIAGLEPVYVPPSDDNVETFGTELKNGQFLVYP